MPTKINLIGIYWWRWRDSNPRLVRINI